MILFFSLYWFYNNIWKIEPWLIGTLISRIEAEIAYMKEGIEYNKKHFDRIAFKICFIHKYR